MVDGVTHVEVDAAARLDLVRRLRINSTPTVLVLDPDGAIVKRAAGLPRKADVIAALGSVIEPSAPGVRLAWSRRGRRVTVPPAHVRPGWPAITAITPAAGVTARLSPHSIGCVISWTAKTLTRRRAVDFCHVATAICPRVVLP